MLAEVLLILFAFFAYLRLWIKNTYNFFEKNKIPYDKPTPFLGSMKDTFLRKKNMFNQFEELYNKFNSSIAGIFDMKTPIFLIRNPDLINQIMIKDFDHFVNHRLCFIGKHDELMYNSLISLQDQKWRDMRALLTPGYTGCKLRAMFDFIRETAEESVNCLKEEIIQGKSDIELRNYFMSYASDVIATTAFGFKINTMKDKENQFFTMGKKITDFGSGKLLLFFLLFNFQKFFGFLNISVMPKEFKEYYINLVMGAMKERFQKKIFRPDMINLLMEVQGMGVQTKGDVKVAKWTECEIVAQCFFFFLSGFDSVATLLCFISHELMENQEIQDKLKSEIDEVLTKLNGEQLTYEILNAMKYLDCVVSEGLRKWPTNIMTDRVCTKPIEIQDPETGESIQMKPGDKLWFPIVGIHRDSKYFSDPLKFNPDRFSEENKDNINPNAFLPFGAGPRMCIAHRFAVIEIKTMIFYLFSKTRVNMSKNSSVHLELDPSIARPYPKNGFWVKFSNDDDSKD